MRAAGLAVILAVVPAACGDNGASSPDAGPDAADDCPARPPFPAGPLSDPLAIPLPADCVEGGIAGLVGRWFVASDDFTNVWGHPRFEQACGRVREYLEPESRETERMRHDTWSDDTRLVLRDYYTTSQFAVVDAACALPDGTIAVVQGSQVAGGEPSFQPIAARRFGWKDELAAGLTVVGSLPVRADGSRIQGYNLVVDGDHAYVAGPGGFDVIDVADPTRPMAVGHVDGYCNDVRVAHGGGRTIAYIADDTTRLIDVTDPGAPTPIAAIGQFSHSLQLDDGAGQRHLFLADGLSSSVPVFDVSDPVVPVALGAVTADPDPNNAVHDLFVDGTMIYANATFGGTVAIDVSAGFDAEVEVGRFEPDPPGYSHASWAGTAGGRAIVLTAEEGPTGTTDGSAFLRVLDGDRASPGFMTQIGRYQTRREIGLHYFVLVGDRAYIAYYEDGVRVVDLSDPTAPVEVAHYNTWLDDHAGTYWSGAFSLRVVGDLIYVADQTAGLIILRDPALTQ